MHRRSRAQVCAAGGLAALLSVAGTLIAGTAVSDAATRTYPGSLTPAQIAQLSGDPSSRVIVLLADQHREAPQAGTARSARLQNDQARILAELRQVHAAHVVPYSFLNGVAAAVSPAEAAHLATLPGVAGVVPDTQVTPNRLRTPPATPDGPTRSGGPATDAGGEAPAASASGQSICPSDPAKPLLEPEALQSMNVEFPAGSGKPAAHDLATGRGVKIAIFPDGLDPNLPDFLRNGKSAITDYRDFSGDGANAVTGGVEAFGDASSLISQGTQVYDLSTHVNPAHPLPAGCTIRIKGVAPGAEVAVMKVFGAASSAFNSEILQGVEYAIAHDQVNILSQSFGGNPVPNVGIDPIAVIDANAVAAGITVIASSGDAGITNTIGTPATNPGVISVAASTTYRLYGQTTSYGIQLGKGGWVSDQVSGLSSSGTTESNRTVDVIAPGEANWSDCSPDTTTFVECADIYKGTKPQPITPFGGTSESAPLTAGVAALVIESYRTTHGGETPSSGLVRQILRSTARDIHAPAADQGSGLVDALRAVQAARSVSTTDGAGTPSGDALLISPNALQHTAAPGTTATDTVRVTNLGTAAQTLMPAVRALGSPAALTSGTVNLDEATDPTFIYQNGQTYGDVHRVPFTVPAGTDRLHAAIAWDTAAQPSSGVRFDLFDPQGRLVMQSRPQGPGQGFSEVEVHDAQPGNWQLVTFANTRGTSYTGPLSYTLTTQKFVTGGSVTPASAVIAPGASMDFSVRTTTPAAPGDMSESVVFGDPASGPARPTVPVTLRSLVPLSATGGAFAGTLTGGNGRMPFYGQELTYQTDVPAGLDSLDVALHVTRPGYQVLLFLVDPRGIAEDVQSSAATDPSPGGSTTNLQDIDAVRRWPVPGRWTINIVTVSNVSSLVTSSPVSGAIRLDTSYATSSGIPNAPAVTIAPGARRTGVVHVTNRGTTPKQFFLDPRLPSQTDLPLTSTAPTSYTLPNSDPSQIPNFVVPPFSDRVTIAAHSSVPITMDISPSFGTPDVEAFSSGNDAVATFASPEVPASLWSCPASERGPFGPQGAPRATAQCGAVAHTQTFDPAVTSSTGNIWSFYENVTPTASPLYLQPGASGDITVTFAPTAAQSAPVRGTLTVETFDPSTFSSDEAATISYSYTAK